RSLRLVQKLKILVAHDDLTNLILHLIEGRRRSVALIVDIVTPDEVKARYDKEVAAMPKQEEVHARHILVKTEDEAK
ncbi:hypothetical protein ACC719_37125, partial [Rhizobium ruizarguesonis]